MKEKSLTIAVIFFILVNGICFHCVVRTVFTWPDFFMFSFLFSIPLLIILTLYVIKSGKHRDKPIFQTIAISSALGFMIYVTLFSCIPFGVNYYCTSDKMDVNHSISNFKVYKVTSKKRGSTTKYVDYKYEWLYEGVSYDFSVSDYKRKEKIVFTIHKGLLGFEVMKDWRLE